MGMGRVEFDRIDNHEWSQGMTKLEMQKKNILWEKSYAGENKYRTEAVSFKWNLPYVTIYWESEGEESDLHVDMDAKISFVIDEI